MSTSSVEITLGTNNSALKSGLEAARGQVENFKHQTHEILMGLFVGVGIEQLLEKFGELKDKAEAFGTTAEAVQRVDQLAQQAGSKIDDVAKAMAKLRVNSDGLAKIGINSGEFIHLQMDEQLLKVAEALGEIEDPAQRVNVAIELFGAKMAGTLLPMLNMGAEEMRAFFNSAIVASNETVQALDDAGDKLTDLKNKITVLAGSSVAFVLAMNESVAAVFRGGLEYLSRFIEGINVSIGAALTGDFETASNELASVGDDLVQKYEDTKSKLGEIWFPEQADIPDPAATAADGESDAEAAGSKRLSLAERLAKLEEEHALKKLEAEERLNQLAEKRIALEQQLAALGNGESDKRKQLEDELVANTRDRLSTEDEMARNAEKADADSLKAALKEQEEWQKQQDKERAAAEKADEEANKLAAKKDKEADRAKMDSLRAQERDLGFVSGIKQVGESGQRLAGVDYSVINAEAEKGIKIQEEIRDLMKVMTEKEYKLEIPDAS